MNILTTFMSHFNAKTIEPQKRNKDGMQWIRHRFPIRGGISAREAMLRDSFKNHPLIERLKARRS